jgi:hypothetical protein
MHLTTEGRNIFTISGLDSFPSPLTRLQTCGKTFSDVLGTSREHRRLHGNGSDVVQAGITTSFRYRPGTGQSGVGANDSGEERDLDFRLEPCGEFWSMKYLLCVIGHLVHRFVLILVEWRHSDVAQVCTGKG